MKKPPRMANKTQKTKETKQDAGHDKHDEDVLRFDDSDFILDKSAVSNKENLFVGKDVAEGDVYDKVVLFASNLNGMLRNAVALHLGAAKREFADLDQNDKQAVNDFWYRQRRKIHEDHGFMTKDTDAIIEVLRKNLEG